jgi:hypothetical protein
MPDKIGRQLISDMKKSAVEKGLNTTSGRAQMRATESAARRLSKQAASTSDRATKAAKAAKAAKIAKLARVSPVGLVGGIALEKGSEIARQKFVEADMKKMSKINQRSQALDRQMEAARKKNQGRINIK